MISRRICQTNPKKVNAFIALGSGVLHIPLPFKNKRAYYASKKDGGFTFRALNDHPAKAAIALLRAQYDHRWKLLAAIYGCGQEAG